MGIVPLDMLYVVDRLPRPGEKVDARAGCIQGGGPVPNTLTGLARLGVATALIAVVGDDFPGHLVRNELVREGIDCRHLIVRKNRPSAVAVGMIEADTGRRTIALNRQVFVTPADVKPARLPHPRLVHLDGRDLEACLKLARWARRIGALVSFDIGSVRNDISSILPLVDHLVVADAFAFPFTGTRSAPRAAARLADRGPGSVVVTEGTAGATGLESGAYERQPAFRVRAIDTTGAGDAFHAGYLYGLLRGADMCERLRLGAAMAAMTCTRLGARAGLPNRRQLGRFLKGGHAVYD